MADAAFMPPDSQSEYAFPPAGEDDADQAAQRNQQIQTAFDTQRFQRGFMQSIGRALASEGAQIARMRQAKGS